MTSAMPRTVSIFSCVCIVFISIAAFAAENPAEKTLSPYFYVENGEEGVDRLPLKSTRVEVTIDAVIARVTVSQTYANEGRRPINASYVFPASTRAAVHGMRMKVGEQVIVAEIQERQKATQTYETAKKAGKSTSLLTEERPNVFTMQVANIMPGMTVEIQLDYTELLVPEEGIYEFVYPTVVGPRYSTLPEAGAKPEHQWIKNPFLKAKDEPVAAFDLNLNLKAGLPIEDMVCPSHQTDIAWQDKTSVRVLLATGEADGGNRDYILRYRLSGKQIHTGLMLFEGEAENFFLLMAQPPERIVPSELPPREYIFVVDVSGSMNGFPLNTAKTLLRRLIKTLRPKDRFNVILFAGSARVLSPRSLSADTDNLDKALNLIDRQRGGGGTELRKGLATALNLPRSENISRSVVVVTDGYIALEKEVFALVEQNLSHTNFFAFGIGSSVNRYLIEGLAGAGQGEPFVVTEPSEAAAAAERFRRYIESPVLTQVKIRYEGLDVYDVTPRQISDLFALRPIVVSGKWRGKPDGKVTITGMSGEGEFSQSIDLAKIKVTQDKSALPYLWARNRLAHLLDYNPDSSDEEITAEVISLGLTYHLLTPHTAFVAVDETVRNPGDPAEDVKQPSPMPEGVSNLAVGGGHNVPEPDLLLMMALLCLFVFGKRLNQKHRKAQEDPILRS